ncbi:MAG: hypothetical protein WCP97_09535 [bacterium]
MTTATAPKTSEIRSNTLLDNLNRRSPDELRTFIRRLDEKLKSKRLPHITENYRGAHLGLARALAAWREEPSKESLGEVTRAKRSLDYEVGVYNARTRNSR